MNLSTWPIRVEIWNVDTGLSAGGVGGSSSFFKETFRKESATMWVVEYIGSMVERFDQASGTRSDIKYGLSYKLGTRTILVRVPFVTITQHVFLDDVWTSTRQSH